MLRQRILFRQRSYSIQAFIVRSKPATIVSTSTDLNAVSTVHKNILVAAVFQSPLNATKPSKSCRFSMFKSRKANARSRSIFKLKPPKNAGVEKRRNEIKKKIEETKEKISYIDLASEKTVLCMTSAENHFETRTEGIIDFKDIETVTAKAEGKLLSGKMR